MTPICENDVMQCPSCCSEASDRTGAACQVDSSTSRKNENARMRKTRQATQHSRFVGFLMKAITPLCFADEANHNATEWPLMKLLNLPTTLQILGHVSNHECRHGSITRLQILLLNQEECTKTLLEQGETSRVGQSAVVAVWQEYWKQTRLSHRHSDAA